MFELRMAYKYARSGGGFVSLISGFSFFGITIGVATLIIVMSVMNGFRAKLTDYIVSISGQINIMSPGGGIIDNYAELVAQVENINGVVSVSPTHNEEVIVMSESKVAGIYLVGIAPQVLIRNKSVISDSIAEGSIENEGVIVGSALARNLRVGIGDIITLVSPVTFTSIVGVTPTMKDYNIAAIFDVGMYEYDNTITYLSLVDVNLLFDVPADSINNIEISIKDVNNAKAVADRIKEILPDTLLVKTWQESNSHFINALNVERSVMFMILMLIIIVAAFNIISSLVILAQDKKMEIAIMKTFGASKASITSIFLCCGLSIGLAGTLVGTASGLIFASNIDTFKVFLEEFLDIELFSPVIYFFNELPSVVYVRDVIWVSCSSCLISLLASTLPALRAAQYNPAALIRST